MFRHTQQLRRRVICSAMIVALPFGLALLVNGLSGVVPVGLSFIICFLRPAPNLKNVEAGLKDELRDLTDKYLEQSRYCKLTGYDYQPMLMRREIDKKLEMYANLDLLEALLRHALEIPTARRVLHYHLKHQAEYLGAVDQRYQVLYAALNEQLSSATSDN